MKAEWFGREFGLEPLLLCPRDLWGGLGERPAESGQRRASRTATFQWPLARGGGSVGIYR